MPGEAALALDFSALQPLSATFPPAFEAPEAPELLDPATRLLLVDLHRQFEPQRQARLSARRQRQAAFDAGALPDFRDDTRAVRESDWTVAPLPGYLADRRVEITGPVEPKLVIKALNSGANGYMADFEDSTAPSWDRLLAGQAALRGAVAGGLAWSAPDGRCYRLNPREQQAVLWVRPRGWHLDEAHVRVDGEALSASLFDAAVFLQHNARALHEQGRGPNLYLPKLESIEEAMLWESLLSVIETRLGLPSGAIKVTVLIETLPAVFEMHEILHALRRRITALNCGRWDYIFSWLKCQRRQRRPLPERAQLHMQQPFLRSYAELLVQSCHRRGAHAMGGMAAQIPLADREANEQALARIKADKQREASAGFDGAWVAHPDLIAPVRAVFDAHISGPHQQHIKRDDVRTTRDDLLRPCTGSISRKGFDDAVDVCTRYLAAWLSGQGCVAIHGLMEDAATAEIARTQLWQWLHHTDDGSAPLLLDDGNPIDLALFERSLLTLPSRLALDPKLPGRNHLKQAIDLLDRLTHATHLTDFLTTAAYPQLMRNEPPTTDARDLAER
ncbi:MAG TPA: malate synthase A [Arenimonas sp.]|nr:malate synthase A [Arenimonas sp.]